MRYIVFAFDNYYPCGGMADSKGTFHTSTEAFDFARAIRKESSYDYVEVYDTATGEQDSV